MPDHEAQKTGVKGLQARKHGMKKNFLYAALILLPILAEAEYINLHIKPAGSFSRGEAEVQVTVKNKGTAPAANVTIKATLGQTEVKTDTYRRLGVQETISTNLSLGKPPSPPGNHIVILKAVYEDSGGYSFSSVQLFPLLTADLNISQMNSRLQAKLNSISMTDKGLLHLSLRARKNFSGTVRFITSDELELTPEKTRVSVAAGETSDVLLELANKSAVPDSTYPVYAIIESVVNGRHISITTPGMVTIQEARGRLSKWQISSLVSALLMLGALVVLQFKVRLPLSKKQRHLLNGTYQITKRLAPAFLLLVIVVFLLCHLRPDLLFLDTTTAGGDTPAHNYLASHLKESLLSQMRIVSWSNDWWCGFPVFQFYFFLPYLAMVALDLVLPFNIAFKLVTVIGILALPVSVYGACRLARFPRITGILAATAMLPVLFDHTHTMWGLNIYSTLSGMIANSFSFPLMVLFTALIYRDAENGRFRISTALIYSAVIASHFFTSVVGTLAVAVIPFLFLKTHFKKALQVVISEGLTGAGIMAWWLVPLVAKKEFAVDFGANWPVEPMEHLPPRLVLIFLALLAAAGIGLAIWKGFRYIAVIAWMLVSSLILFLWGFHNLSPVFVNVRLWPFMIFSGAFLSSVGLSLLLARLKFPLLGGGAVLLLVLAFGIDKPNDVSGWAEYNYEGLEKKEYWHVIKNLALPLDGTPGRLANDLHDQNNLLGSSRIFECVPHLVDKPVLEGGIVNSAFGSMFSYYVQGETSRSTAGYPPIVKPTTFNFTNATRHLELLNVKHFIARWDGTRKALGSMQQWQHIDSDSNWDLYELTSHDGDYVVIPERFPVAIIIDPDREKAEKEAVLEWLYNIDLVSQPFALLDNEEDTDSFRSGIRQEKFRTLAETNAAALAAMGQKISTGGTVSNIKITDRTISFTTSATGLPHIIKTTYYPNWKVKGAPKIHMVTPGFMLVYPEKNHVELHYGYTRTDNIGRIVSLLFFVCAIVITVRKRRIYGISQNNYS